MSDPTPSFAGNDISFDVSGDPPSLGVPTLLFVVDYDSYTEEQKNPLWKSYVSAPPVKRWNEILITLSTYDRLTCVPSNPEWDAFRHNFLLMNVGVDEIPTFAPSENFNDLEIWKAKDVYNGLTPLKWKIVQMKHINKVHESTTDLQITWRALGCQFQELPGDEPCSTFPVPP